MSEDTNIEILKKKLAAERIARIAAEAVANDERIARIIEAEARIAAEARATAAEVENTNLKMRWVREAVTNALAETRRYHASVLTRSCRAEVVWQRSI